MQDIGLVSLQYLEEFDSKFISLGKNEQYLLNEGVLGVLGFIFSISGMLINFLNKSLINKMINKLSQYLYENYFDETSDVGLLVTKLLATYLVLTFVFSISFLLLLSGWYLSMKDMSKEGSVNERFTDQLIKITKDDNVLVKELNMVDVNAFNIGTPECYYTIGLYDFLRNDRLLISVLLHEYGHYLHKDIKYRTYNLVLGNLIFNSILHTMVHTFNFARGSFIVTSTISGSEGDIRVFRQVKQLPAIGIEIDAISYILTIATTASRVRKRELLADSYAAKVGYARELKETLQRLEALVRQRACVGMTKEQCDIVMRSEGIFDSHPTFHKRINELSRYIKQNRDTGLVRKVGKILEFINDNFTQFIKTRSLKPLSTLFKAFSNPVHFDELIV